MLSFVEATKLLVISLGTFQTNNTRTPGQMSFDWNKEKAEINFLQNRKFFGRKEAVQRKYDHYLANLAKKSTNNSDLDLKERILNTELPINSKEVFGIENQITLRKNNFPYNYGDNKHYLLWIHPNCPSSIKSKIFTLDGINQIIDGLLVDAPDELRNSDRIIFRNAPENKSVLLVEHFHIVFKAE